MLQFSTKQLHPVQFLPKLNSNCFNVQGFETFVQATNEVKKHVEIMAWARNVD
jgi:hypothetical protein